MPSASKTLLAPSILNSDFSELGATIGMLNRSEADWVHVDVMDGVFVPNISFGFPIMEALKAYSQKELDVHLMIQDPAPYLKKFKELGAKRITVHTEACTHIDRVLNAIKKLGIQAGVALNPGTSVTQVEDLLYLVDLVLLMSVNPGFGGQDFIPNTFTKIKRLTHLIAQQSRQIAIQVDGGVDETNCQQLAQAGVDELVIGSAIFGDKDPLSKIKALKELCNSQPGYFT